MWRLGLSVDPEEQKSLGITDKVLRATKPRYARNEHDRKLRAAKLESIVKQLITYDSAPKEGILPNFGPLPNLKYDGYGAILISEDSLVKLGQKIVRGITYLVDKSFIDDTYKINVYFVEDNKATEVVRTIEAYGATHDKGPGIIVKHVTASEGRLASLWLIEIWGKLKIYAVVIPVHQPNQSAT